MRDHLLQSYDYSLPQELIATYPAKPRENAKLLIYDRARDHITHSNFWHFEDFIPPQSLLVFNNTKVIKARIFGHKLGQNGGRIELLYHRHLGSQRFLVQLRGKVREGTLIALTPSDQTDLNLIPFSLRVCKLLDSGFREVEFFAYGKACSLYEVLAHFDALGHIPLPPYIKRADESLDEQEYQSVFAKELGAVAAPTASLHFSDISRLQAKFDHCFLTLHVGAGTFLPVESEDIRFHKMHSESFSITQESWKKIQKAEKLLCIGTTVARTIEYLYANPPSLDCDPYHGDCDLFLHPQNPPRKITALLTNFHLPKSTLLMLVSSLVGREKCLELYAEAIKQGYRFYSYGDGMLIL